MSTPPTPTGPTAHEAAAPRPRVRWRDLAWVTWRQHRLVLIATSLLVLVGAALLTTLGVFAPPASMAGPLQWLGMNTTDLLRGLVLYPAVVAGFWTAPLIAGEHDQRTHLLAWSQDVSPARWLTGKALTLGAVAIPLALLLGFTSQYTVNRFAEFTFAPKVAWANPFETPYFPANPLVQLGYTLFAFTLGLTLSLLIRRTLPAVGTTLATFVIAHQAITTLARPYYQPPLHRTAPVDSESLLLDPTAVLTVNQGYLDTHGSRTEAPLACSSTQFDDRYITCLREHGIVRQYVDYQPADRLATFQLIEFGIYATLAALLVLAIWFLAHRSTRH